MSYKKLRKELTPEELVDAFVFPVKLTAKQQKEAAIQLAEARKKPRDNWTEEAKIASSFWHLRFKIEEYLRGKDYNAEYSFGNCLKKYVEFLGQKRKTFAQDISIDESLLSQLINEHRLPPDYIAIRLELHSDNIIPATHWIQLVEKQRLHKISNDKELRKKERPFVHGNFSMHLAR